MLQWDIAAVITSVAVVVGLVAVMPRRRTVFAWAGSRAFQVYVMHDCERATPKPTPHATAIATPVATFHHRLDPPRLLLLGRPNTVFNSDLIDTDYHWLPLITTEHH